MRVAEVHEVSGQGGDNHPDTLQHPVNKKLLGQGQDFVKARVPAVPIDPHHQERPQTDSPDAHHRGHKNLVGVKFDTQSSIISFRVSCQAKSGAVKKWPAARKKSGFVR